MVMATDRLIDFEGDYGADFDHQIRLVIAGYGLMHELGVAAARASCPGAKELLIVGPAWGDPQLDALLLATWRERLRLQGVDDALIDRS